MFDRKVALIALPLTFQPSAQILDRAKIQHCLTERFELLDRQSSYLIEDCILDRNLQISFRRKSDRLLILLRLGLESLHLSDR
jgi:hypothetical protein